MTAALHNDLAAVYEKHHIPEMARSHRTIARQFERVRAADAAAEAAVAAIVTAPRESR